MRVKLPLPTLPMTLEELVDMLCCPETRQDLRLADADELGRLNAAIGGGALCDLSGETVAVPASAALVRADGEVVYLVRNNIPVMIGGKAVRWADVVDDSKYRPADAAPAPVEVEKLGEEKGPSPSREQVTRLARDVTADITNGQPQSEAN